MKEEIGWILAFHIAVFSLLILLLIPLAFAANEDGKITAGSNLLITRVDAKVDGLTSRNLDYNGEISRKAKPDSTIIFSIKTENSNDTFKIEDITIIATIEELDLEKTLSEFDLDASKSKTSEIEFKLPSDVEDRDYDIFIEAEGDLVNGTTKTTQRVEYALDLVVEIPEEQQDSSTTKIDDLDQSIKNLSNEIGRYFEPYATCNSERTGLNEQIKTKDAEIITLNEYKARFDSCSSQKDSCSTEMFSLKNDLDMCKYNITSVLIPQFEQTKSNYWMGIFAIIIAGVGLYFYNEKKRKPVGEHEVEKEEVK